MTCAGGRTAGSSDAPTRARYYGFRSGASPGIGGASEVVDCRIALSGRARPADSGWQSRRSRPDHCRVMRRGHGRRCRSGHVAGGVRRVSSPRGAASWRLAPARDAVDGRDHSPGRRVQRCASSVARVTGGLVPGFLRPAAACSIPLPVSHRPAGAIRARSPSSPQALSAPRGRSERGSARSVRGSRGARDRGAVWRGEFRCGAVLWGAGRGRHVQVAAPGASPRWGGEASRPGRWGGGRSGRGIRSDI